MTDNRDPQAAWTYHQDTKHSYVSIRTNPHFMDWSNQPLPFKIYPTLELLRLPNEVRQTGVAALGCDHGQHSLGPRGINENLTLGAGHADLHQRSYA